jgi:F-type H+-transporting ATPase subunit epsilon
MADSFTIEIATPERSIANEEAVRAQIPGKDGYFGVLPDHAPLLSKLGIGTLSYVTPQGGKYNFAVHGGYVEVLNNHVRVLADEGEPGVEIDYQKAQREVEQRSRELENLSQGSDPAQALSAVMSAQARADAARKTAAGEE